MGPLPFFFEHMMRHLPVPNYHQQQTIFGFPAHEIEAG
jgi:hypothetical protein